MPQLESSRLLTENLLTYCQMIGEADNLDKLERDWVLKCLWVLRAYGKPTKQSLPLWVKDILAPLNQDFNYRYCFGNVAITNILKDLNTHRFNQQQSIKQLTDFKWRLNEPFHECLDLFVGYTKFPFKTKKCNPLKEDCRNIWEHAFITDGPAKGRVQQLYHSRKQIFTNILLNHISTFLLCQCCWTNDKGSVQDGLVNLLVGHGMEQGRRRICFPTLARQWRRSTPPAPHCLTIGRMSRSGPSGRT